jgi:hypothetical protein
MERLNASRGHDRLGKVAALNLGCAEFTRVLIFFLAAGKST